MRLALRLLLREGRAGELSVLLAALLVAVGAVTTVSALTDRVERALSRQANTLLAADLALVSDHEPAPEWAQHAAAAGLRLAWTVTFPSMVLAQGRSRLAEIKAVSGAYPLRGRLRVEPSPTAGERAVAHGPPPGEVWADPRLLQGLGLTVGDRITVGQAELSVGTVLLREPDRAGEFFGIAPRLMMHGDDLAATGLLTAGSRAHHRLLLAGSPEAVAAYERWARPRLGRGERLEKVADARPEIRAALERAHRYLSLAALVAVVLAAVAVALATRGFVERHLDACAVMRCLGASRGRVFRLYLAQFALMGLVGGAAGAVTGLGTQALLVRLLPASFGTDWPAPGPMPLVEGVVLGGLLLLSWGAVPLARLGRVPTLRVLRRELAPPTARDGLAYLLGGLALAGLFLWKAGEARLGLLVGGGLAGLLAAAWLAAGVLLRLVAALRQRLRGVWFYGLANLTRRPGMSRLQVAAFAVGLMTLLLLGLVRGELLASWQQSLPRDAPNRFLINIQADQVEAVRAFFRAEGLAAPRLHPMVRGRLLAINDRPVSARDYADERSRHLVEREFNLSWADAPPADNRIVAGTFWRAGEPGPQWSVEKGIAERLGIRLGDRLRFDVAGTRLEARITSLRQVHWDSMRVNFFVIGTPGLLADQPASFITSFHLPKGREAVLDRLVARFPNVTVIDVAGILGEVIGIVERVAQAVQFVFLFTVLAGLVVLYAAVVASRDERLLEVAVMRALGGRRRQLMLAQWIEFGMIGTLAGLLAATGAALVGWLLASRLLDLPFGFDFRLWLVGAVGGGVGVALAANLALGRVLAEPPLRALRA